MSAIAGRHDLVVIGAGINGAAVAREAALAGLRPLVLDQHDIGGATSAASTRLIHGGLRYLEYGELSLVRESLLERERLLELAPHLVRPLEMYLPLYRDGARKPWQIRVGLGLYDLLSRGKSLPRHRMLDREALLNALPGLEPDGLRGGARYYDAQVEFPERLVIENMHDAISAGAALRTYTRATRIVVDGGRVRGVEWRSREGERGFGEAPLVVNATGPWVDTLLGGIAHAPLIGGTKGSHLVATPFPGAPAHAVYAQAPQDGRPFFVVPWNGLYLIGTTDERFVEDPAEARMSAAEMRYLAAATERFFPAAAPLARYVRYTQAGIRPLPHTSGGRTAAITRRHLIHMHERAKGLYSIVGGKLTTHRALAEDAVRCMRAGNGAETRTRSLPGALGAAERDALHADLAAQLGRAQAARLWRIYGGHARDIAALARDAAELASPADPASPGDAAAPVLVAELVYAVEREWARSLADILLRRCMAGLEPDRGAAVAAPAARWLARLGLWDEARAAAEVEDYRTAVARFDPPSA